MLGLWTFATTSTPLDIFGVAIAAAVMIIIAEVLWTVTVNYLRAKAAAKDEANA